SLLLNCICSVVDQKCLHHVPFATALSPSVGFDGRPSSWPELGSGLKNCDIDKRSILTRLAASHRTALHIGGQATLPLQQHRRESNDHAGPCHSARQPDEHHWSV